MINKVMEIDNVDVYKISIASRLCANACLGLHDSRIFLGVIADKNKKSLDVYDISENMKEIASIDITRSNIRRLMKILIGIMMLCFIAFMFLPIITDFLPLSEIIPITGVYTSIMLWIPLIILGGLAGYTALTLISYLHPAIAYDPAGRFILIYKDGLVGYFDIDKRKTTWRKARSISGVFSDLVNIMIIMVSVGIVCFILYSILHIDVYSSLLEFYLYVTFPIVLLSVYDLLVVLPALFKYFEKVKISVNNGYVGVLCPGVADREKIIIVDRDWNVVEKFTVRMRRWFLQIRIPQLHGLIFDRSLSTIICWDLYALYKIDMTTKKKIKLMDVREKSPTTHKKWEDSTGTEKLAKVVYFEEIIRSACWLREGEELLVVTNLGKMYLVNTEGESKLVGDVAERICHATRIRDKIYLYSQHTHHQ